MRAAPREPSGRFEDVVRQRQGIGPPRAAADDDGDELVVPESGGAEPEQLFSRAIVGQGFDGQAIYSD